MKDGGPAFPTPSGHARVKDYHAGHGEFEKTVAVCESGMSLRDYFAGQTLTGILANAADPRECYDVYADRAYQMADAMLAAREKTEEA